MSARTPAAPDGRLPSTGNPWSAMERCPGSFEEGLIVPSGGWKEPLSSEVEASTIKNIERLFLTGQPFCFVKRNHSL